MDFKVGKTYSDKTILKTYPEAEISGQQIGGEHTITAKDGHKFVMSSTSGWRGGTSYYYDCVAIS